MSGIQHSLAQLTTQTLLPTISPICSLCNIHIDVYSWAKHPPSNTHPYTHTHYTYTPSRSLSSQIFQRYTQSLSHTNAHTYYIHSSIHTHHIHTTCTKIHTHKPTPTHRERNRDTCVRSHYRLAQEMSANMGSMCTQDTINSATVTISVTIFDEIQPLWAKKYQSLAIFEGFLIFGKLVNLLWQLFMLLGKSTLL